MSYIFFWSFYFLPLIIYLRAKICNLYLPCMCVCVFAFTFICLISKNENIKRKKKPEKCGVRERIFSHKPYSCSNPNFLSCDFFFFIFAVVAILCIKDISFIFSFTHLSTASMWCACKASKENKLIFVYMLTLYSSLLCYCRRSVKINIKEKSTHCRILSLSYFFKNNNKNKMTTKSQAKHWQAGRHTRGREREKEHTNI